MKLAATKCYRRQDLSYQQAKKGEEYYTKNDFKLNLIDRFTEDYMPKQLMDL